MKHATLLTAALVALCLMLLPGTAQAGDGVVVALTYFDNNSKNKQYSNLQKGITSMLITKLAVADGIRVVERERLEDLLKEIELGKGPFVDSSTAQRLGEGLGAELIVTGSFMVMDDQYQADARVVMVASSEVIATASVSGELDQFFQLQTELAEALLTNLGAQLAPLKRVMVKRSPTQDFGAFKHFSDGLDAADKGDKGKARKAFSAALKADPAFSAAQERLSALEERVTRLEQSGGLVVSPRDWRDHWVNFERHLERKDYKASLRALQGAIESAPERVELWTGLRSLPKTVIPHTLPQINKLSKDQRTLVKAWLSGTPADFAAAHRKAIQGDKDLPWAHILALHDVERRSRQSLVSMRQGSQAVAYLSDLKPKSRATLLLDPDRFEERKSKLQQVAIYPGAPTDWEIFQAVDIFDEEETNSPREEWDLDLIFLQAPSSPVTLTLEKDLTHPHWLRHQKYLTGTPGQSNEDNQGGSGSFQWVNFDQSRKRQWTEYGAPLTIPIDWLACEPKPSLSFTDELCFVTLHLAKTTVPPGPWDVTVEWENAEGVPTSLKRHRLWVPEFKILQQARRIRDDARKHFLARLTEPYGEPLPDEWQYTVYVCGDSKYRPANAPKDDFKRLIWERKQTHTIHYDWDFSLWKKGDIEELDTAGWQQYQKLIIDKGASVQGVCQTLPLPLLKPGPHKLCLVATHSDGRTSAEPYCIPLEIPKKY